MFDLERTGNPEPEGHEGHWRSIATRNDRQNDGTDMSA
jgi:hypothetical protein